LSEPSLDATPVDDRYLTDASGYRGYADRVFIPSDHAGVIEVLREASSRGTPVTVAGASTGVTGGAVPRGGWVLSLEKLTRLEIHPGYAIAGAGVPLADLQGCRGAGESVLSARSHRDLRFHRRQYFHQR
jgi:FAD/FMN-containing dehydrogenase